MKRIVTGGMVAALLVLHLSCSKDDGPCTTCPPLPKDPRTYTWTVDTIAYPGSFQTLMTRMWASGPDNVYIVGHNDQPGPGTMFRFNGTAWTTTRFHVSDGGPISGAVSLSAVHGFSPTDVWVAGIRIYSQPPDSSLILHYDGVQWTESRIAPRRGGFMQSLWGATPTDIWAGGVNTLLHYDGVHWSHFPIEMPGQGIQFLSIAGWSAGGVYMVGRMQDATGNNDTVAYILYGFDGLSWTALDSSISVSGSPAHKFGGIINVVGGSLYSVRQGVSKRVSDDWQQLLSVTWPLAAVGGINEQNLFAAGSQSQIYHFNQVDWYRYPQFQDSNVDFLSLWTNGETIFVAGNDGSSSFVARGK